jgi:hypothetical protein
MLDGSRYRPVELRYKELLMKLLSDESAGMDMDLLDYDLSSQRHRSRKSALLEADFGACVVHDI